MCYVEIDWEYNNYSILIYCTHLSIISYTNFQKFYKIHVRDGGKLERSGSDFSGRRDGLQYVTGQAGVLFGDEGHGGDGPRTVDGMVILFKAVSVSHRGD